jgi:hypothetical protein
MHCAQSLQDTVTDAPGLSRREAPVPCDLPNMAIVVFQDDRGTLIRSRFFNLINYRSEGRDILETVQERPFCIHTFCNISFDNDNLTRRVAGIEVKTDLVKTGHYRVR